MSDIVIYTDGACSGNPGPCGAGMLIIDGDSVLERSKYLGEGTNNIAELQAIGLAVLGVKDTSRKVRILTDSKYCIGVLTQGWRANANTELIAVIKKALSRLSNFSMEHVKAHSGITGNERADSLATQAVRSCTSTDWRERGRVLQYVID